MSQAGILNTESGPVPPDVATTYQTEDGDATPNDNIIIFSGDTTIADFNAGITTQATDGDNEVKIFLTNRVTGFTLTNGPATNSIFSINLSSLGGEATYAFEMKIAAYSPTVSSGASFSIFCGIRTDGVTAFICDAVDIITNSEIPLDDADVEVSVSGNTFEVLVTGVNYLGSDLIVRWRISGDYVRTF